MNNYNYLSDQLIKDRLIANGFRIFKEDFVERTIKKDYIEIIFSLDNPAEIRKPLPEGITARTSISTIIRLDSNNMNSLFRKEIRKQKLQRILKT